MEKTPADRLKEAREARGYRTAKQFSDTHGIPQPTYSTHEKGSRKFDLEAALSYAALLGVSAGWLLTGEGEGSQAQLQSGSDGLSDPLSEDEITLLKVYRALPDPDKAWLLDQVRREAQKAGISFEPDEQPPQ